MSFESKDQASSSTSSGNDNDFVDPPGGAPRAPTPPDPSDPDTTHILREVSLAAHVFSNSRTQYLTDFLGAPRTVPAPPHIYREDEKRPPYARRLSNRHPANDQSYVPCFAKDYARIIHSQSFRKLQGKTQLVPSGENYFFRTRLSHSLEVSEIATRIARRINKVVPYYTTRENRLDLDLVASAALLHDIGHPPFGHSGEEGLNEAMGKLGGFEGNAQTLRLVTHLENRLGRKGNVQEVYEHPRGLNLTVGTLASIIKYDQLLELEQPKDDGTVPVSKGYYVSEADVVGRIKTILGVSDDTRLYTLECQIMDIADDIAYSAYDLEDSMEAGIVSPFDFISVEDEILDKITKDVSRQFGKRGDDRRITPLVVLEQLSKVFGIILTDADEKNPYDLCNWTHRAVFVGRSHNEAMLHAHNPLIRRQFLETLIEGHINAIDVEVDEARPFLSRLTINPDRLITLECMKSFTYHKVITSQKLQIPHYRGKQVVKFLFATLRENRRLLPAGIRRQYDLHRTDPDGQARIVCDYIASLTDHEAMRLYHRLNGGRNTSVFDYYA